MNRTEFDILLHDLICKALEAGLEAHIIPTILDETSERIKIELWEAVD